jgi:hypothetical protein
VAVARASPCPRGLYATSRLVFLALTLLACAALAPSPGGRRGGARAADGLPTIGGCQIFPADNVWNTSIDTLLVDVRSAAYVASISATAGLKADFGAGLWDGGPIGIPSTTVPATQPRVAVTFDYADESDPGPYPIPPNAPIEGGPQSDGDRHVLVVQSGGCRLYETFASYPQPDGSWRAGSGAVFDLSSNALRPASWTSADAASLPILPRLVRYDEVAAGEIRHALRFTAPRTQRNYVWPARHFASSSTDPNLPPMGQRFRLKAGVDISGLSPANQVIARALKTHGMLLADNGSAWYLSGVPDARWDNEQLRQLLGLHGSDFEAVDESSLMVAPDSGRVRGAIPSPTPTSTPKSSPSSTPTATPRPTATPTPTPSWCAFYASLCGGSTPTPTPVATPRPTITPTPTPNTTPTPRPVWCTFYPQLCP